MTCQTFERCCKVVPCCLTTKDKLNRCNSSAFILTMTLTKHRAPSFQPILHWWDPRLRHCWILPCLLNSAMTAKSEVQPAAGNYLLPKSSGCPSSWLAEDALHPPQSLFQHLWVRPRCNVTCGLTLTFWEELLSECTTDPRGVVDYLPPPFSFYLCCGAYVGQRHHVASARRWKHLKMSIWIELIVPGGGGRKKSSLQDFTDYRK